MSSSNTLPTGLAPLPTNLDDKGLEKEGLRLLNQFAATSLYHSQPCDPVFEHPLTGAKVYCGGWSAANNLDELAKRNIRRVINCQDMESDNTFENKELVAIQTNGGEEKGGSTTRWAEVGTRPRIGAEPISGEMGPRVVVDYRRFHINGVFDAVELMGSQRAEQLLTSAAIRGGSEKSKIQAYIDRRLAKEQGVDGRAFTSTGMRQKMSDEEREKRAYAHFTNFFSFVDEGLARGESALIHCAAGMHRAGGATVGYLMHRKKLSYRMALKYAQSRRSVINPYHQSLLDVLESFHKKNGFPEHDC